MKALTETIALGTVEAHPDMTFKRVLYYSMLANLIFGTRLIRLCIHTMSGVGCVMIILCTT